MYNQTQQQSCHRGSALGQNEPSQLAAEVEQQMPSQLEPLWHCGRSDGIQRPFLPPSTDGSKVVTCLASSGVGGVRGGSLGGVVFCAGLTSGGICCVGGGGLGGLVSSRCLHRCGLRINVGLPAAASSTSKLREKFQLTNTQQDQRLAASCCS